jgi:hypothetical protein
MQHQLMNGNQQTRAATKILTGGVDKGQKVTKTFDYDKRALQKDRLSENFSKRKVNNASSVNYPQKVISDKQQSNNQHILKSAASSPSLGN